MEFLSNIWEFLKSAARSFWSMVKRVVAAIGEFFATIVNNFKQLIRTGKIQQGRDTPFILDPKKTKEMIANAPNVDAGLFSATYNDETEEVENMTQIEGQLDAQTKSALSRSQNGIVTLS